MILEPRKIKSATLSTVSPSICYEVIGPDACYPYIIQLMTSEKFIRKIVSSS